MDSRPLSTKTLVEEFELLAISGTLPPEAKLDIYSNADSPTTGLLAVWKEWLRIAPRLRRSRAARIHSELQAAIAAGAELTFTLPNRDRQIFEKWLGPRICWWPRGIVNSQCVGLVSSRLRRNSVENAPVIQALRLSITAVDSGTERLVASAETSLCGYIELCAGLFEVWLLRVSALTDHASSTPWIDELFRAQKPEAELLVSPLSASRSHNKAADTNGSSNLLNDIPTRDRVVALLSQRLFVLTLRRNGNWAKLLQAGFEDGLWAPGSVRTLVGNGLCADNMATELQGLGAVRWHLAADTDNDPVPRSSIRAAINHQPPTQLSEKSSSNWPNAEEELLEELTQPTSESEWLIHWTRGTHQEWTGEARTDYLKSIVLSDADHARTALGTLERIIHERRIRASSGNTRAAADVVCLSDVPLAKLVTQRVFRQHRGRWDFEHYGIGIKKRRVRSLGGRPVIYGNESTWQSLPEGERPWFQPELSRSTTEPIDWTIEKEWRIAVDLSLDSFPDDDLFIFCATDEEASQLRSVCNWRIISVERLMARCQDAAAADE